ncbi:helix-turn-helix domain-containing protein, partial [Caenispirillum bisanense]|uniref:helix-turn-helix domain-containing protein n=1 Tax=Caenispirillum bisanense TaxID=414052 RepID=UPI0031DF9878
MRPSSSCSAGTLLRHWRTRRRLSQLALAAEAGVSQRHLSFVESGRAAASRDMLLHLAEHLDIPLRERNALLAAGGFAPVFPRHDLADAGFAPALAAVRTILAAHEPWPALAVDRSWTLVAANRALAPLLAAAHAGLLAAPVNVLRLSLHPRGLGPQIVNYRDWRAHVLERLARDIALTADVGLLALRREIESYPVPAGAAPPRRGGGAP